MNAIDWNLGITCFNTLSLSLSAILRIAIELIVNGECRGEGELLSRVEGVTLDVAGITKTNRTTTITSKCSSWKPNKPKTQHAQSEKPIEKQPFAMSDKPTTSEHLEPNSGVTDSPLHGPTLSTSTSSFEALDPHDPLLSRMAAKMFHKTNEYVLYELSCCLEDYRLLENLNRNTITKYSDMNQLADTLLTATDGLKQNFKDLVRGQSARMLEEVRVIDVLFVSCTDAPAAGDRRDREDGERIGGGRLHDGRVQPES